MERQKYYDRDQFTYDEKSDVARKSDNRCCHCGALKFVNYGATVDHFIPLHKGGSNRMHNLIMLCEACNKEKADKIVDISYIPYLKDEYKDDLYNYLRNYIQAFDYVERNRMFACDEYSIKLETVAITRGKKRQSLYSTYKIKYATWDDFNKICDYLEKYLKKYDQFASREAVEQNIGFWMQFGCIYYLERHNEIQLMSVFTIKHVPEGYGYEGVPYDLNMYIFSYYATENAFNLAYNMAKEFPRFIAIEQNLTHIPVILNICDNDKLCHCVFSALGAQQTTGAINAFQSAAFIICGKNYSPKMNEEGREKLIKFMNKFDDVIDKIKKFYVDYDNCWVDWMIYDILNPKEIDDIQLFKDNEVLSGLNDRLLEYYK